MDNSKLLQLTLNEKIKRFKNHSNVEDLPEFTLPYSQRNDDKDNQIIDYAQMIAWQCKHMFSKSYGNDYAFGLYRTYSEVMEGNSKLNKLTQDYIKQNFKDEPCFRRYFMNHKNSPKSFLMTVSELS